MEEEIGAAGRVTFHMTGWSMREAARASNHTSPGVTPLLTSAQIVWELIFLTQAFKWKRKPSNFINPLSSEEQWILVLLNFVGRDSVTFLIREALALWKALRQERFYDTHLYVNYFYNRINVPI